MIDVNDVQGIIDRALGKPIYKYFVGRQPKTGGIGTRDWETTNTADFLASSETLSANSIEEVKAAMTGSVNVGSIDDGDAILIVPTEVANAITSITNSLGYKVTYESLVPVDGYTCIFIGKEYTGSEIKVTLSE